MGQDVHMSAVAESVAAATQTVESVRARRPDAATQGGQVYVVVPPGHPLEGHPHPVAGAPVISPSQAFDLEPHMDGGYDHPRRAAVLLAYPSGAYFAYELTTGHEFSSAAYGPGAA